MLQHPLVSAVAGVVYSVGRVLYFVGYATGTPNKRMMGSPLYAAGLMTLLGICVKTAGSAVVSKLTGDS